ncbi:hypothetical protein Atep_23840 [Allochromatium tepidum]|uniref:Uncharacterized protein n=2 Tax=Allochromatium tepidum TaxID=553982 RepID=A0ABM7QP46_9GAMM|nr:hypothetical protein Atep_23840 [Allochromatium tepidum]
MIGGVQAHFWEHPCPKTADRDRRPPHPTRITRTGSQTCRNFSLKLESVWPLKVNNATSEQAVLHTGSPSSASAAAPIQWRVLRQGSYIWSPIMTKFFTVSSLACCLALSWSIGYAQTTTKTVKPYAYSMKVAVSLPKGSDAEASLKDKTKPSTTALTPCTDEWKRDVLSFQLTYDAGKRTINKKDGTETSTVTDVYFFFYNPQALGLKTTATPKTDPNDTSDTDADYPEMCEINATEYQACDPKIWVITRPAVGTAPLAMRPLAEPADIRFGDIDHIYLSKDENLGTGKISDSTLRSYMKFDDLTQGLWSLIGIVGPIIDLNVTTPPLALEFDDPTKWAAWDAVSFMLGSPWGNGKICQ